MNTILPIAVIIAVLFLAVFHAARNIRSVVYADSRVKTLPRFLFAGAIILLCDFICGGEMAFRILFDMTLILSPILIISFSIKSKPDTQFLKWIFLVISGFMSIYYLLCALKVLNILDDTFFLVSAGLIAVFMILNLITRIWARLRDVKSVVRSGSVWAYLTLCVDVFYASLSFVLMMIPFSIFVITPGLSQVAAYLVVVLIFFEILALSVRISGDSAFVLMHEHERVIVESMKISQTDIVLNHDSRSDEQYKELFERIQEYFEKSRPYLDGSLTINDIVKVVYSNKVYISKAICRYTGRNFRQFVNYYRVMFSIDAFRNAPELKVSELAEMSGFNTVVTFTMAFRLFMSETPSDWCRKERIKILKLKK